MQKILVKNNEMAATTAIDNANGAAKAINERLVPALKTIGISITQEVLKDCFSGATKTEKNYFDALEKDLKGIKTPSISNSLEATATNAWEKFKGVLLLVRREAGASHQQLTIIEGEAVLSLESEQTIRETYRTYLSDEKEIAAYHLFIDIADKLNQLFKGSVPLYFNTLFPADANGVIHAHENIDYTKFI